MRKSALRNFLPITYAIASNIEILNKIRLFLDENDSSLLDFILDSVYKSVKPPIYAQSKVDKLAPYFFLNCIGVIPFKLSCGRS